MKLKKLKWQKSNLKDRNKKIWNLDSKFCILAYCFLKFLLVHGLFFNHMNLCNFNSIQKYTYLLDMILNKRDLDFRIPLSNVSRVSHHVVFLEHKMFYTLSQFHEFYIFHFSCWSHFRLISWDPIHQLASS